MSVNNGGFPGGSEIPMSKVLNSEGWENLDTLWGVNAPKRYICVSSSGFRLRKKTGFIGGSGANTPSAVNYGGPSAIFVHTVQVKGRKGQTVYFTQGVGNI